MIDNFSVKLLKNTRIIKQKESNIKLIYWLKGSGKINLDLDTYNMKKRDDLDERRVCIKLNMSKKKEIHDILSHCSKMIKKELTL